MSSHDDLPTPHHTSSTRGARRFPLPTVLHDEPQYRLLFFGQVLSILGDRVTMVVLPFAVLAVGGHVGDVAIVSAAQFLPFAVLALPAGVWADRLDRKKILVASDVTRFACQLLAGVLLVTDQAHVVHLAAIAAVYGAADAFFAPAFTGLLPGTVAPVNLQPANALRGLSYSTGSIVGPVLGGLLVAGVGEVFGSMLSAWGSRESIAITAVMGSQFAALAAVAAFLLFGERLARVQVVGVVLIVVGVTLLAAASA